MLNTILSGDYPRSKTLTTLLLLILLALLLQPFLFKNVRLFTSFGTIAIFIIVVAAYDLMLGYTHVVSFAHTIFFGLGAYGVAIATNNLGASLTAILIGLALALLASLMLALLLGLLSLRVKTIFFALVSLAVAFAVMALVTKLYTFTGGEDGLRVRLPKYLGPAFKPFGDNLYGFDLASFFTGAGFDAAIFKLRFTGRHLVYYLCLLLAAGSFVVLLRLVNSPLGQVLKAIRENETRAQALGYQTLYYRTFAVVIAGLLTCLAGALFAIFNRYVDPGNTLDFQLMIFILLMTVIGGMGSIYGAVIGVSVFVLAQNFLQDLLNTMRTALPEDYLLANIFNPEHWLLWFGSLFILSVYFFPQGIVGRLRGRQHKLS